MHLPFSTTPGNWTLILLAAFIIGLSKAGLKGIDMMNIVIMAIVFGGKASTGIVLPLLCVADIMAVIYYNRHAQWKHFWKLIPWMVIGILAGVVVGKDINEDLFRKILASIVVVIILLVLFLELNKKMVIPANRPFVVSMGLASGFTTMLGNLAGAFSNLYFLAMRVPRKDFIGTAAWLFLVINFFKLPFQVVYWKNIDASTLLTDLWLLPSLVAGFWTGIAVVSKIHDTSYRRVVIVLTLVGAAFIFLK